MLYYAWKSIGAAQAQRALNQGASVWTLPIQFGNGMARFAYGLQTIRGACYVVSDRTFAALTVPASAWPKETAPATCPNPHRPFGPGT